MSTEPGERRAAHELLRAAFRELHGSRLHGFTLLLTLGNRPRAARLAAEALAEGAERSADLRHPERAAAWLRARVVKGARGPAITGARRRAAEPEEVLRQMGVDTLAYRGLSSLGTMERAALIAGEIERLDPLDVATVLDASPAHSRQISTAARRRYLRVATPSAVPDQPGPIALRVHEAAHRAMS